MKNLLNLGKTLSKTEQKQIFGGWITHECQPNCQCDSHSDCAAMPNPDYDHTCRGHMNCPEPIFVIGSCVNGECTI